MLQKMITGGQFDTEAEAWVYFDEMIERSGSFGIHREVEGDYMQPRFGTELKRARVDRMLIPTRKAREAGWSQGAIAIEGKRSGAKIGRLVTQAMDYTRCVFELKEGNPGLLIVARWVFVWPWPDEQPPRDALESIMANNRIGYIVATQSELVFRVSMTNAIRIRFDGSVEVHELPMGNKRGSR